MICQVVDALDVVQSCLVTCASIGSIVPSTNESSMVNGMNLIARYLCWFWIPANRLKISVWDGDGRNIYNQDVLTCMLPEMVAHQRSNPSAKTFCRLSDAPNILSISCTRLYISMSSNIPPPATILTLLKSDQIPPIGLSLELDASFVFCESNLFRNMQMYRITPLRYYHQQGLL